MPASWCHRIILTISIAPACAAPRSEPRAVPAPLAAVELAPAPPPRPLPRWEHTIEPALARFAPALQAVIRPAFRRGIGSRPSGAGEDGSSACNAPVRTEQVDAAGDVFLGCGAALWVDGEGAPRGYREGIDVTRARGQAISLAIDPGRPDEKTIFTSPEGPGVSIALRPEERITWHFPRGTSTLTVLELEAEDRKERWIAGTKPARDGEAARAVVEVDGWDHTTIMVANFTDVETMLVYNAPLALSSDGAWLLELRGPRGAIRGMQTEQRFPLPAACLGWLRFFDFEPRLGRFHVAVSNSTNAAMGEVRHCQIDRAGRLVAVRPLRPLPGSGCINESHHTCSVSLDHVWLGGLVLSVHEDTGMGPMGSDLLDARSGRPIPFASYEARADRIEGFAAGGPARFVTLRNVGGRLVRTEEPSDDAFHARWNKEREHRPPVEFAYCVVSGIPIPAALCPPEEAFRAGEGTGH